MATISLLAASIHRSVLMRSRRGRDGVSVAVGAANVAGDSAGAGAGESAAGLRRGEKEEHWKREDSPTRRTEGIGAAYLVVAAPSSPATAPCSLRLLSLLL